MVNKLVDIFDENNKSLKQQEMLKEVHRSGKWHRVSHVWIYNLEGDVLLMKRYSKKKLYPDMWDVSLQVHVSANEQPIQTAVKAMKDKLGIETNKRNLKLVLIKQSITHYEEITNREYFYSFVFRFDGKIENLKMKVDRMNALQFYPIKKIEKELKMTTGKYTPRGNYWFEVLDEIETRIRNHN